MRRNLAAGFLSWTIVANAIESVSSSINNSRKSSHAAQYKYPLSTGGIPVAKEFMQGMQKGNLFARDFKRGRIPTLEANIKRAMAGSPVV